MATTEHDAVIAGLWESRAERGLLPVLEEMNENCTLRYYFGCQTQVLQRARVLGPLLGARGAERWCFRCARRAGRESRFDLSSDFEK